MNLLFHWRTAYAGLSRVRSWCLVGWTVGTIIPYLAIATAHPQEKGVPVDAEPFTASLVAVNSEEIQFRKEDGREQSVPVGELVHWGTCREPQRGPVVILRDGGLLTALTGWKLNADTISIESDIWKAARIPRRLVRGVLLQVPGSAAERDAILVQMTTSPDKLDQCVLLDNDVVAGTIVSSMDDAIEMKVEARTVTIPRADLRAVIFRNLLNRPRTPSSIWSVGFLTGDCLFVDVVLLNTEGGKLVTGAGLALAPWKPDTLLEEICFLRPPCARCVYLSDLDPTSYKHVPLLELAWPYHTDRNVGGGQLRHAGKVFHKGLGLHSMSSLSYALDGQYSRFQAEIGLDDVAARRGSVICRAYVNSGSGWKLAFESAVIRGQQPLVPVSVDVSGAQRISLIVDRADQGDEWDYVNWIDARLTVNFTE